MRPRRLLRHHLPRYSAAAAARINGFLGCGLEETAMAAVVDPALHRLRRG